MGFLLELVMTGDSQNQKFTCVNVAGRRIKFKGVKFAAMLMDILVFFRQDQKDLFATKPVLTRPAIQNKKVNVQDKPEAEAKNELRMLLFRTKEKLNPDIHSLKNGCPGLI